MKKGQEQSLDLIIALGAFTVALLVIVSAWVMIGTRINYYKERVDMGDASFYAAEALVTTPGDPANWNEKQNLSGVNAIGLADSRNVINADKLVKLQALLAGNGTVTETKEALGVGRYSMSMEIVAMNGTRLYSFGDAFNESEENAVNLVVQRIAMLNGSIVNVKVGLWE